MKAQSERQRISGFVTADREIVLSGSGFPIYCDRGITIVDLFAIPTGDDGFVVNASGDDWRRAGRVRVVRK